MSDPRETEHIECDCVPDLGPSHCHLCSVKFGHPITWSEAGLLLGHAPVAEGKTNDPEQ